MDRHPRQREYYAYLLAVLGMTCGAVLADNLILLLAFWELAGLLLFLLITIGGRSAFASATKTLLIVGGADLALMLGIGLVWNMTGTTSLFELSQRPLALTGWTSVAAYTLMVIGAFAKGGVIPLHSWIPEISTEAPVPVMAYLPAALDKLLGIYLLSLIALDLFVTGPIAGTLLMAIGAATILSGVLMALVQHDVRKMLAFHNISQVGYMVLGIGTGVPVGIIGGLFHMFNLIILKGCLFLVAGSVKRATGRTDFAELGGLAKTLPWTFACGLIAALGISGVPPLNAFVSKWLIYQGLLDRGGSFFPLFLVVAMFGSALTLASFMKLLYSVFLGDRPGDLSAARESPAAIVAPMAVLAAMTVGFGLAYGLPVDYLIRPILGAAGAGAAIPGIWQAPLAALLLVLSLLIGGIGYVVGKVGQAGEGEVFLGGELIEASAFRVPGTDFYGPVKESGGLRPLYDLAERGAFDLYTYAIRSINWAARIVYAYFDQALADLYQEVIPGLLSVAGEVVRLLNARLLPTRALWLLYIAGAAASLLMPENATVIIATQIVACFGMLGWALLAWAEPDLQRLTVLAATSQAGLVVLGSTLSATVAGSYLITSGIAVGVLWTTARSICRMSGSSEIRSLSGIANRSPGRFFLFLFAALWLSGLPPFGSFFSKFQLGIAAESYSPLLSIVIAGTAVLTLWYFLRPIRRFMRASGRPRQDAVGVPGG